MASEPIKHPGFAASVDSTTENGTGLQLNGLKKHPHPSGHTMDTSSSQTPPASSSSTHKPLHVAIIGGGIAGVTLAIGLAERGVSFTLYERASSVREIGAGIGLSPNAEACMKLLSLEKVHAPYKRVAAPNGSDYFQWIDGHKTNELMYRLHMQKDGFQGCRRSDLVEELLKEIDPRRVKLGKQAEGIRELGDGGGVEITFADGTTETADVVVGCDGIRSRVRQLLLGEDSPASYPGYSGKFCYRTLVPMEEAREKLGHERTRTRFMYNGPGAHAITYPVGLGENTVLNVLLVVTDPNPEWPLEKTGGRHTDAGSLEEARAAVADWHPAMKKIVELFPEEMDKWAIFDSLDHPAPYYSRGAVCLAGDAAHTTGPHLGAGAGFGIEDALMLSALLEAVDKEDDEKKKGDRVRHALEVYNSLRLERTQWLVAATRGAVALFQWQDPDGFGKAGGEVFGKAITGMFHRIWHYDVEEKLVHEALAKFRSGAAAAPAGVEAS